MRLTVLTIMQQNIVINYRGWFPIVDAATSLTFALLECIYAASTTSNRGRWSYASKFNMVLDDFYPHFVPGAEDHLYWQRPVYFDFLAGMCGARSMAVHQYDYECRIDKSGAPNLFELDAYRATVGQAPWFKRGTKDADPLSCDSN